MRNYPSNTYSEIATVFAEINGESKAERNGGIESRQDFYIFYFQYFSFVYRLVNLITVMNHR